MDPLTEPQIHRAIRALDAGDPPDGATLRTALLMALAWHAAQAEIAALRGRMAQLERALQPLADWAYPWPTRAGDELTPRQVFVMQRDIYRARALLGEPQGSAGPQEPPEIAPLQARIVALEATVRNLQVWANRIVMCPHCGNTELEYPGAGVIWCPACKWETDAYGAHP